MLSELLNFAKRLVGKCKQKQTPKPNSLIDHTLTVVVKGSTIRFINHGSSTIKNINITGREMYKFFGFSAFGLDDTHAPKGTTDGTPIYIEGVNPKSELTIISKEWSSLDRYKGPKQFLIGATFTVIGQEWPSSIRSVPVKVIV